MSIPPFDREKAIENFGCVEVLREASQVYLDEARKQYIELFKAYERCDFESLREKAHLIKGGLVYLQATPSANLAKEIEDLAEELTEKSSSPDQESKIGRLVEELDVELERLLRALRDEHVSNGMG